MPMGKGKSAHHCIACRSQRNIRGADSGCLFYPTTARIYTQYDLGLTDLYARWKKKYPPIVCLPRGRDPMADRWSMFYHQSSLATLISLSNAHVYYSLNAKPDI